MSVRTWHKGFEAKRDWWATTMRLLTLVLVLIIAAPDLSLAADFASHGKASGGTELSVTAPADDLTSNQSTSGVTCHVHCSCHQAIPGSAASMTAPPSATQRIRARSVATLASAWTSRLSRPPRA